MSNLLFTLMGPTAAGKTDIALELATRFPFEIVSVDSVMIYREMNIGSAKPDSNILTQYPHHLIDILDPDAYYSAKNFCSDIDSIVEDIYQRQKIPLLVGGTMMYFNALEQGLSSLPSKDDNIRAQLNAELLAYGSQYLHKKLQLLDPVSAARIHENDTQRLQRALEVVLLTQKPLSEYWQQKKQKIPYKFINMALFPENRAWLHLRIEKRFHAMLQAGLIAEVENLLKKWPLTLAHPSLKSIGYRQVYEYLQGEYDFTTLAFKGTVATRQLAKRQLTWIRSWQEKELFLIDEKNIIAKIILYIEKVLHSI